MILFNPNMQTEKIAVIGIAIIIVGALGFYAITRPNDEGVTLLDQILENLSSSSNVIELGDCADVHYIGRYASNDTVFSTSYDNAETKTGGTPLHVFINDNGSASPPVDYSEYYTNISSFLMSSDTTYLDYLTSPFSIKQDFYQYLIGMKEGETKTTELLQPEDAFGLKPDIGDSFAVNETFLGYPIEMDFSILDIQENQTVPAEYGLDVNTSTFYVLRDNSYYLDQVMSANGTTYSSWDDSTKVSAINDTTIWLYTTPTTAVGENFTWIVNEYDGYYSITTTFPTSTSAITSMNNSTIVVTHTPQVGNEIVVDTLLEMYNYQYDTTYTVVNVTDDKINTSYPTDDEGNISYFEFDRTETIQRNVTQDITSSAPGQILEEQIFLILRAIDENFTVSLSPLADEEVYFEFIVEEVYKTSQES